MLLPPEGNEAAGRGHERSTHAAVWSLILSSEDVYYAPCASKAASGRWGADIAKVYMLAKLFTQVHKLKEIAIDLSTVRSNG